jgi:hypothetical protein
MKYSAPALTLIATLALCAPSAAQSDGSNFLSEVALANTNTMIVGRMNDIAMQETARDKNPGRQTATAQSTKAMAHTKFVSLKSRTKQNLTAVVNHMRKTDPAAAAKMEQLFASTDIIDAVGGVMDRYRLQRNNVAHAYALYWVAYWALANNEHEAPTANAIRAVAAQAELGFAGNAQFASMSDAQKQAAAEELMALAAILDATSEQAKTDPALAEQAARASLEGSRKSGLDLDKMMLTENGFVPAKGRKRSDASDVVGEGEEKALAANDVGDDKDIGLSATQLALIAAAGGAGLAGVFLFGKAMGKKG